MGGVCPLSAVHFISFSKRIHTYIHTVAICNEGWPTNCFPLSHQFQCRAPLHVNTVPNCTDAFTFGTSHNSEEMEMAVRYWFRLQDPDLRFDRISELVRSCDKCINVVRNYVEK